MVKMRAMLLLCQIASTRAATWYFHPVAAKGPAAAADKPGQTYETAWRRDKDIQWSAIEPGDTLYLCGRASQSLGIPANFSGTPGAHVTIDGSCPTGGSSADPLLWVGGNPLAFPEASDNPAWAGSDWEGPDANGIYSLPYGGSTSMAIESSSRDSTDPASLSRLTLGECPRNGTGPAEPASWKPGTFCDWIPAAQAGDGRLEQRGSTTGGHGKLFYKPMHPATAAMFYAGWPSPFPLKNLSHVTIRNLRLYGVGYELVSIAGGQDLVIRDSHIQWAGSMAIQVGHLGCTDCLGPGLHQGLIENNTIHQCATGVYFTAMHTVQNSNHVVVRNNRFIDIDQENYYHNGDGHAIGVQGGSFNVFEHNTINGAGGSGITFYQGPDNKNGTPTQDMHDNVVRFNQVMNIKNFDDANQPKNQHGIETGGGVMCPSCSYNNSVSYNILINITHIGLRSKTLVPGPEHGKYAWRYLNNVVIRAGIGFSTAFMCRPIGEKTCYKPEHVANNVFLDSVFAHQDGWDPTTAMNYSHRGDDWQTNSYWPDGPSMFCYGLCAWPGKPPCKNCTDFATFQKDHPHATRSLLADPMLDDSSEPPQGLRPAAGSPLLGAGTPVLDELNGLDSDWVGAALSTKAPSIGVFESSSGHERSSRLSSLNADDRTRTQDTQTKLKTDDATVRRYASVQIKPPQTVVHFNGTTEMRSNPERGFRHELDDFCAWSDTQVPRQWHPDVNGSHQMQRLFEAKPNNLTVVQAYCYLDGESDLIPPALLETLDRGFDRLRASGVKALFRFAYDHCPVDDKGEGNYTVERILKHVAQLGPTMQRNADAVYVLQAGFVGCWGEWHSSRAWMEHRQLEGNSSDIARIVAAELEQLIPPDRKMMMRYPWDKCCGRDSNGGALRSATSEALGLEWGTVDASTAHSSKAFARIGFDDDGFMCCGPTNNDGGTWGTSLYGSPTYVSEDGYTVGRGWDYERVESPFLPMDGEMYWNEGLNGSGTAQEVGVDGHAVAHRMFLHHYTTLSLRHGYSKLDGDSRAESIDRWMETPLDLRFVRKWGLPLSDAFFSLRPAQPKASCAAVQAAVPPADRVTCSKGVYPNGTMAQQQQKCLANGCCFDPVHSPGPHPWCFLSQIPAGVVALRPDYTIYAYIRDHLGYRLELQRAAFPAETTIADGSVSFSVTITLKNLGFSIPHNRRPPSFVLLRSSSGAGATNQSKSQASPIVLQTPVVDIDPRSWQPRAIGDPFSRVMLHEFTAAVHGGGKGLSPGEYKLGLYLPDERQPLQGRADYAIRVANDDVPWATWGKNHDEGGVNVLGQMLLTTG